MSKYWLSPGPFPLQGASSVPGRVPALQSSRSAERRCGTLDTQCLTTIAPAVDTETNISEERPRQENGKHLEVRCTPSSSWFLLSAGASGAALFQRPVGSSSRWPLWPWTPPQTQKDELRNERNLIHLGQSWKLNLFCEITSPGCERKKDAHISFLQTVYIFNQWILKGNNANILPASRYLEREICKDGTGRGGRLVWCWKVRSGNDSDKLLAIYSVIQIGINKYKLTADIVQNDSEFKMLIDIL